MPCHLAGSSPCSPSRTRKGTDRVGDGIKAQSLVRPHYERQRGICGPKVPDIHRTIFKVSTCGGARGSHQARDQSMPSDRILTERSRDANRWRTRCRRANRNGLLRRLGSPVQSRSYRSLANYCEISFDQQSDLKMYIFAVDFGFTTTSSYEWSIGRIAMAPVGVHSSRGAKL